MFGTDGLIAGDDNGFVDVFGEASAREIVDRSGKTLKDRAYSLYASETLHKFVGNVSGLK